MFRCRQCDQKFGANPPKTCPQCGALHDRSSRGLWLVLLMDNLITLLVIGAVVALAMLAGAYLF